LKSPDGYHGKTQLLDTAKRLKVHGIKLLVDFHYSDSWADPGKQPKPAAWEGLDFDGLKKAMYDHTFDICNSLMEQGTPPEVLLRHLPGSNARPQLRLPCRAPESAPLLGTHSDCRIQESGARKRIFLPPHSGMILQ
jgi:hypothetical protein